MKTAIRTLLLLAALQLPVFAQSSPPSITVQPATQMLPQCPGAAGFGDVVLTVEASGTPAPDFYWMTLCPPRFPNCGCILRPPQPSPPTMVIPGFTPACAAGYYVVVSNAQGCVTSELARVVVAPEVSFSDDRFPPPNSRFELESSRYLIETPGLPPKEVVLRDLSLRLPGSGQALPAPGAISTLTYNVQAWCQLSTDGGATFRAATCSGQIIFSPIRPVPGDGTTARAWDLDIENLVLSGGTLPTGMTLQREKKRPGRESPTLASLGRIRVMPAADGTFRISSFFDIWTELSLDGGASWTACADGSCRALLQPTAHEFTPPNDNYPPMGSEISQAADGKDDDCDGAVDAVGVHFAGSVTISNLAFHVASGTMPFTDLTLGGAVDLDGDAFLDLVTPMGSSRCTAPAHLRIRQGNRASTTFQMEVDSLSIGGGTLPAGIMVRESPSMPSRGYASRRANGGGTYRVSSFFDIFTEISFDGGGTWVAADRPVPVGIGPALSVTPIVIYCPPDQVLLACGSNPIATYEPMAIGQDGPVVCNPPSGSAFPPGVTTVTCTATNRAGTVATCSFTVTVRPSPGPEPWPCTWLPGMGIPYELVGGATTVLRPDRDPESPAMSILPAAGVPKSGILMHPGPAQGISFTTVLDFKAPVGAGFDLLLPPDPAHPADPPILSLRNLGADGYRLKMNKRHAEEAGSVLRVLAVNTNDHLLEPVLFTPAEIEATGLIDIAPMGGATNCHVTIDLNCLDGSMSVEFPGTVSPSARHKGWDGCIYGPDRPRKKPPQTSRVMLVPPVIPGAPPITDLFLYASGVTELPVQQPSLVAKERPYRDGHVTLIKAYDDGAEQGVEFRVLSNGGGVSADLGEATGFQLCFHHFENGEIPDQEQVFRIFTNRPWTGTGPTYPPPPPIEARLTSTAAGVGLAADYGAFGISTITLQVRSGGTVVSEHSGAASDIDTPSCLLSRHPFVLGCPGVGVPVGTLRLADPGPFTVFWPDGTSDTGDELLIIPEVPPGITPPTTFRALECLASAGVSCRIVDLQTTPAVSGAPLQLVCPADITQGATDASGAVVHYSPILLFGDCPVLPLADVACDPPSGSAFPLGTTTVTCTAHNGCGEIATCSFKVTVNQIPAILTQPSNQWVTEGETAHLTAELYSDTPTMYRWEIFCPPSRPDWPFCGCLPSAAQEWRQWCLGCPPPFVDFPEVTAQCGGAYYLVASNVFGVATSQVAVLTVLPKPEILCPPDQVLFACGTEAIATYEPVALGNAGSVVCAPPSGSAFPLGVTTVICSATNGAGVATSCSFTVTVKPAASSARWPCEWLPGLGMPFELLDGASAAIRPERLDGNPAVDVKVNSTRPTSGLRLHPGPAQAIIFTTELDFNAPNGARLDLVLPPVAGETNGTSIGSFYMSCRPRCGWNLKMNKKCIADDTGAEFRTSATGPNGEFPGAFSQDGSTMETNALLSLFPASGVTSVLVTVTFDLRTRALSLDIPYCEWTPDASRKGWDGLIYGEYPRKKKTARFAFTPVTSIASPPITELELRASGLPSFGLETPALLAQGRKWGDGHVTLMKAYDDGEQGLEFRPLADGGGVQTDLGEAASFQLRLGHFEGTDPVGQQETFRMGIGPIRGLTNRPAPPVPPVDLTLLQSTNGVLCTSDFTGLGATGVSLQLWNKGVLAGQAKAGEPAVTLRISRWPDTFGQRNGDGMMTLTSTQTFTISGLVGDEIRMIPELPAGVEGPPSFSTLEILGSQDMTWRIRDLGVTPAAPVVPLRLVCPGDMTVSATDASGAVVNYLPTVLYGDCPLLPLADVTCTPPSGSVFPLGSTTVTCTAHNGCGETTTCSFTVTVSLLPAILEQPVSVSVPRGGSAQISARISSGTPAVYRWGVWCPPDDPRYPDCGCIPPQTWRSWCAGCPPPFVDFPSVTGQCAAGYYLVVSNAFGMVTSQVAQLTVTPASAGCVVFDGLLHCPLGGASLSRESERRLPVRNLGSSGQDGVEIKLGRAGGWSGYLEPISTTDLPEGAYLKSLLRGTVDGQPNAIIASLHAIKRANSLELWTDFSALGAASLRYDYLRHGVVVGSEPGQPADRPKVLDYSDVPEITDLHYSILGTGEPCESGMGYPCLWDGWTFSESNPFRVVVGGQTVLADEIRAYPEGATAKQITGELTVSIQASGISEVILVDEQVRPRPPVLPMSVNCPADMVVTTPSADGAIVNFLPTVVNGDCPLLPVGSVTCLPPSGSLFPVGTTTVTCVGNNGCGEHPTCTFTVTVKWQPEFYFSSSALPPIDALYVGLPPGLVHFDNGVVLSNLVLRKFQKRLPPPAPGASQELENRSRLEVDFSPDDGKSWTMLAGDAEETVRTTAGETGADGTQYYDTEMLKLITTNKLILRESPTRASLGRTSVRVVPSGGYRIGSFFDVWTEISLDGGKSWVPAQEAAHLDLRLDPGALPTSMNHVRAEGGSIKFVIQTRIGLTYIVEYKEGLNDPSWSVLSTITGTGNEVTVSDSSSGSSQRFYRIRIEETPLR